MAIQERAELRLSWCIEAQQEAAQADGAGLAFSIFDLFALLKLLTLLGCRPKGLQPANPGQDGLVAHNGRSAQSSSSPQHHSQLR